MAYFYHWQPSELMEMDVDELLTWYAQAERLVAAGAGRPGW